ncbi:hypothetical protein C1N81_04825 (plasmid) [Streptomyces sp. SGAir0957]
MCGFRAVVAGVVSPVGVGRTAVSLELLTGIGVWWVRGRVPGGAWGRGCRDGSGDGVEAVVAGVASLVCAEGLWVIEVGGEVDCTQTNELTDTVAEALRCTTGPLAFDLGRVSFCDSSLLNCLLHARRERPVLLVGVTPQTRRLLKATGTASVFTFHDTLRTAAAVRS